MSVCVCVCVWVCVCVKRQRKCLKEVSCLKRIEGKGNLNVQYLFVE